MTTKTYTNDLEGFIENVGDLKIIAFNKGETGLYKTLEYTEEMAKQFKKLGEPLEGDK